VKKPRVRAKKMSVPEPESIVDFFFTVTVKCTTWCALVLLPFS